jgi:hypothetical protein
VLPCVKHQQKFLVFTRVGQEHSTRICTKPFWVSIRVSKLITIIIIIFNSKYPVLIYCDEKLVDDTLYG